MAGDNHQSNQQAQTQANGLASGFTYQNLMASYTQINAKTMADIVTTSNTKEQKWVLEAHREGRGKHPFTSLIGGYKGGKPITEVVETHKLAGDTIYLHRLSPLAGPGRQGEASRDGQEEKQQFGNYSFTIGRQWKGTAQNTVARDQTVIGSNFDRTAHKQLSEWHGVRQGWDTEVAMQVAAHSRNTVRPLYAPSREALRTRHFLQSETITRAKNGMATLQAKSLLAEKSASGSQVFKYLLAANQYSLGKFQNTPTYTNIVAQAAARGGENPLFSGKLPDWNGTMLWEWQVEDHTGAGAIGAPCIARAVLGEAIAANTTAPTIKGGGSAAYAADLKALYFENFSNSAYIGYEGQKRAADVSTVRYLAIQNISGADAGKIGFYSYQVNTGNQITSVQRLRAAASGDAVTTLGNITWNTAPWIAAGDGGSFQGLTDAHPIGSLIYEVNSYGVPFCYSYMLGDQALMSGYGSIDGKVAMGQRTEAKGPHGLDYGVGLEMVWGIRAVPRADGLANGYALIESAWQPDGFPDVL